ncbi:hypothetical protein JOM56_002744 [Amanita muscaria]
MARAIGGGSLSIIVRLLSLFGLGVGFFQCRRVSCDVDSDELEVSDAVDRDGRKVVAFRRVHGVEGGNSGVSRRSGKRSLDRALNRTTRHRQSHWSYNVVLVGVEDGDRPDPGLTSSASPSLHSRKRVVPLREYAKLAEYQCSHIKHMYALENQYKHGYFDFVYTDVGI